MLEMEAAPPVIADYAIVERAIEFISSRRREQPSIDEAAKNAGLSLRRLEQILERWAGLTTTAFLQAISVERARELLRDSAAVLDAACSVDLFGLSRPRGPLTTHEALTPGDRRRDGIVLRYGFHACPFGEAIVVAARWGMAGLGFVDDDDRGAALGDMRRRWPGATFREDPGATAAYAAHAFDTALWRSDAPLRLAMIGSDFDVLVWETLLRVPFGRATTYSDIARKIGKPNAARAVGAAVGRNPISFVIPCHRAIGRSGALTGYHWGLARKQAMIAWEAGRASCVMRLDPSSGSSGHLLPQAGEG
jgi:AraC family transcriptional regulator, regulatory protein of adaptative response / methylated-DNA-[protein]-cysteine methyltransferase